MPTTSQVPDSRQRALSVSGVLRWTPVGLGSKFEALWRQHVECSGSRGHAAGQEVGAEANDQRKEVLGTELKSKIAPTPQPAGSLHLTAHTQPPGVPVSAPHHAP